MKKLFALLLILLIIPCAFAEDYVSMTTEELQNVYSAVSNELLKRTIQINGKSNTLIDNEYVTVYLTGRYRYIEYSNYVEFETITVNNSDTPLCVSVEDLAVNKWETYGGQIGKVNAMHKDKGSFGFDLDSFGITSLEGITDIEFYLKVYNAETFKTIFKTDVFNFHYGE